MTPFSSTIKISKRWKDKVFNYALRFPYDLRLCMPNDFYGLSNSNGA